MRTVLLGDSHLARVRRDLHRISTGEVVNAAVGGTGVRELLDQATHAGVGDLDAVVVSTGTNDAAPWKQVPLDRVRAALDEVLDRVRPARWVYVVAPGVDEQRQSGRTRAGVAAHSGLAEELFLARGARVVDAPGLLAPLGARAFVDDGVHLTGAAYGVVLPAIREALS